MFCTITLCCFCANFYLERKPEIIAVICVHTVRSNKKLVSTSRHVHWTTPIVPVTTMVTLIVANSGKRNSAV